MEILFFIIFVILATSAYASVQGAPFLPMHKRDVSRFLKLANIQTGEKMYDLGCGDGRVVCAAAQAGAQARGLEISVLPFLLSHVRRLFCKDRNKVKISYQNVWSTDLSDADLIYVWLMPKTLPKLKAKFEQELKQGTKIVVCVWPIKGWTPTIKDQEKKRPNLYLYKI